MQEALIFIALFAVAMFGLCQSVDLYWKIKGFFKKRSQNRRTR
jgi:hypothetical protein